MSSSLQGINLSKETQWPDVNLSEVCTPCRDVIVKRVGPVIQMIYDDIVDTALKPSLFTAPTLLPELMQSLSLSEVEHKQEQQQQQNEDGLSQIRLIRRTSQDDESIGLQSKPVIVRYDRDEYGLPIIRAKSHSLSHGKRKLHGTSGGRRRRKNRDMIFDELAVKKFEKNVRTFLQGLEFHPQRCIEIKFPCELPKSLRRVVHEVGESLGVSTRSKGYGAARHVLCSNPDALVPHFENPFNDDTDSTNSNVFYERFVDRGYIAFEGPLVDYYGKLANEHVLDAYRKTREDRDGPHYHITIINSRDLRELCATHEQFSGKSWASSIDLLLRDLKENVPDDWQDMGLGRVRDDDGGGGDVDNDNSNSEAKNQQERRPGKNAAYFRVVLWPKANEFRRRYGLEDATFHITVGFIYKDIHDKCKDITTII